MPTHFCCQPFGPVHPLLTVNISHSEVLLQALGSADTLSALQIIPQGPTICWLPDAGDDLDVIIQDAFGLENEEKGLGGGTGLFASLGNTMASVQRFARSLTR